ncbi:MAG: hypothetical protein AB7E80_04200 [Hyphomicrobiaceae bacterium]
MTGIDQNDRQSMMQRDVTLVATAALSLLNGMHFSPWFDPVAILIRPFVAGTFLGTPLVFLYLTSIFISVMTLLIGGVPAALYERFKGDKESTPMSLYIWLAATLLLSAQALLAAASR